MPTIRYVTLPLLISAQWLSAFFFPTLTLAPDMTTSIEHNVPTTKADQFRGAQPCLGRSGTDVAARGQDKHLHYSRGVTVEEMRQAWIALMQLVPTEPSDVQEGLR